MRAHLSVTAGPEAVENNYTLRFATIAKHTLAQHYLWLPFVISFYNIIPFL